MAETTKIEWCDHTFNPWIGCQKVSPGCDFCYAETWDNRFGGTRWGPHAERTRTAPANWNKPYIWDRKAKAAGRRYRVFCASLADVFDNQVPDEWRSSLWRVIAQTPNLDWQLLTKRPQNIARMLPPDWGNGWPGVWLGVSVEDQQRADERIPLLLDTPAALRWVSYEPALGPVRFDYLDIRAWKNNPTPHEFCDGLRFMGGLDWLVCGGESGAHARPFDIQWGRSTIAQCKAAHVPCFVKQLGAKPLQGGIRYMPGFRDNKGGNPDEWPADLRVREMPA